MTAAIAASLRAARLEQLQREMRELQDAETLAAGVTESRLSAAQHGHASALEESQLRRSLALDSLELVDAESTGSCGPHAIEISSNAMPNLLARHKASRTVLRKRVTQELKNNKAKYEDQWSFATDTDEAGRVTFDDYIKHMETPSGYFTQMEFGIAAELLEVVIAIRNANGATTYAPQNPAFYAQYAEWPVVVIARTETPNHCWGVKAMRAASRRQ